MILTFLKGIETDDDSFDSTRRESCFLYLNLCKFGIPTPEALNSTQLNSTQLTPINKMPPRKSIPRTSDTSTARFVPMDDAIPAEQSSAPLPTPAAAPVVAETVETSPAPGTRGKDKDKDKEKDRDNDAVTIEVGKSPSMTVGI